MTKFSEQVVFFVLFNQDILVNWN